MLNMVLLGRLLISRAVVVVVVVITIIGCVLLSSFERLTLFSSSSPPARSGPAGLARNRWWPRSGCSGIEIVVDPF